MTHDKVAVPSGGADAHQTPRRKRRPLVRLLRFAIITLVALVALYPIAANVFLSTPLFEKLVNAHPEDVVIHFERAWSILPEHVHATKLSIRGRDSNVEWILTLDEAEVDISFASLLKQKFAGSHVRGKGLSFRLRQRPEAVPTPEELSGMPPITGLLPYDVKPPKTPSPDRWDDSVYHLWTLDLEDVIADDVREVWVDQTRFEGSAHVDGRFYFKPLRAVEVGPLHVAVASGNLSTAKGVIAEAFDGSDVAVTVPPFDPRTASGGDILGGLSLAMAAHVTFPDPARLPLPVGVKFNGPIVVKRAALRVAYGRLQKDSQLVVDAPNAVVTRGDYRVSGSLAVDGVVAPGLHRRDRLTFHAELTGVEASHRAKPNGTMRRLLRAPTVIATGDAEALDLQRLLEDLHVVADVPNADLGNIRELSRYIPPATPVAILNGDTRAELHVEVRLAEKRANGRATLRSDNLEFRLAKVRVRGRGSVAAEVASYHFDTRRLEGASLTIGLSNGVLASTDAPGTPLVHLNVARLAARAPRVDLADPLRDLQVSISMPSADVVSRGLLHAYLPKGSEMQILSSHSRFSLNVDVAINNHLARGSLDLQSQALTIGYRDFSLDAQIGASARVHDWHWETGVLALDEARIDVANVTMSKDGANGAGMAIARIGLAAKSEHFDFADPLAKVSLSAFFLGARVADLSTMNSFLPAKATFRLEGVDATFGARMDLDVEDHSANGVLRAHASSFGAGGKTVHLRGDVDLLVDFAHWDFKNDTIDLHEARVELAGVAGSLGAGGGAPDFSVGRLVVATRAGNFDLARPTLKGADFQVVVENGELPDVRSLAPILSKNGVLKLESGAVHVAANVTVSHERRSAVGQVDVALRDGAVRLRKTRLSGELRFVAQLSGFDPDHDVLDISGTRLEMRDIAVTGASATTAHWKGDVVLPRGYLRLSPAVAIDTIVQVDARDARPILAIVFEDNLSNLVLRLTDVPHLTAFTRVVANAKEVALLDLDVEGGNLALFGSYAVRGGRRRGAMVARKAFLAVGLRIDESGTHPRFFGLKNWLRERTCGVDALVEVERRGCPRLAAAGAR